MFKSKEIRWFNSNEDPAISAWFEENGYLFENTEARIDHYLPLKEKEDIGIKLGENNIEVKQRLSRSEKEKLVSRVKGYFEEYVKWSFSSAEDDSLAHEITEGDNYVWIPVKKERIGFKLTEIFNGEIKRIKIDEFPDFGCQVEYTRIKVKDDIYYTFALEWFGDKELNIDLSIIKDIIGENRLKASNSMGYAEFLNKF
ncbi:hypothetical protein [Christiangramia echinicola]|uniref:CYTH domain-containing protein n=1 Tax=Christiangramia echinicola TaxID=279359 RepID=A0A1H1R3Z5_9FLAO|nr:hypothetical protein [Christiangramia echinicola]SDS30478.1 hypothetical protein SAMN04488552_2747 [Christiangramia echinicola]